MPKFITNECISVEARKSPRLERIRTARLMRSEGHSLTAIGEHLGVESSFASRLSRLHESDLDVDPEDIHTWEYQPLWVRPDPDSDDWRKILVREDGKVWSCQRGSFYTLDTDADGYRIVNVAGRAFKVHRLVLHAFKGPPPSDEASYARHLNGSASCNFYTNLAWGTLEDNAFDKVVCGRQRLNLGKNSGDFYVDGRASKLADSRLVSITRKLSFDAGHRIPFHWSKCSNAHGHLYTIEATFFGLVKNVQESTDDGMVLDFSEVKEIMQTQVVDKWDHGFLVWRGDKEMLMALSCLPDHKTIIVDLPPTAECLALIAFVEINRELVRRHGFSVEVGLEKVCLYETPNCWVEYETNAFQPNVSRSVSDE